MTRRLWRNLDFILLGCVLALVGIGIATIHSATLDPSSEERALWEDFVFRQTIYAAVGLVVLFGMAALDYRLYQGASAILYGISLLLLALIFAFGRVFGGAQSWFDLRLFPVQPSELVKIVLILVLAKYFSDHREDIEEPVHLLVSFICLAIPAVLIYLQPDLGTALILGAIWLGMAWTGGIAAWQLGVLGVAGLLAAPAIWFSLEPYMQDRVIAFLNPGSDPTGQGYNAGQALISIGSGGLWGKGYAHGTQSQLRFLRVRHTDFIFSVYAEEFGFVGSILLFGLFVLLLWRILRAASLTHDPFGRLIACGVAMMVFTQSFINLAVNLSLLPTTGLPLPFISYGGSSLLTLCVGVGLVQSVVMRHRKIEFE